MNRSRRRTRARRAAQIQGEIRQILFCDWDPFGMHEDLPEDEYDCCIAPVYRALTAGASEDQLMFLLSSLESDFGFGWRTPFRVKCTAARRLLSVNVTLVEK